MRRREFKKFGVSIVGPPLGEPVDAAEYRRVMQIQSQDGKSLYAGALRMHASAKPTAIDFEHRQGALTGKAWKGIYVLDGDTLTICDNAANLAKARPAAFAAKTGSGYVLITFQRTKP